MSLCPIAYSIFDKGCTPKNEEYYRENGGYSHWRVASQFMMTRHPKWFVWERMMTGPASIMNIDGLGKVCVTAVKHTIRTIEAEMGQFDYPLLEDMQDSCHISPFGLFRNELIKACDDLNVTWERQVGSVVSLDPKHTKIICPYMPLFVKKDGLKVEFLSRYGFWEHPDTRYARQA